VYPADVPLTGHNAKPGEKPPVYPAAANARTQAAANAFAEFYIATWDWAYGTTDTAYMRHYFAASCGLCDGVASGIDETAKANHWYLGGRLSVHGVDSAPIGAVTAEADFCSMVSIDGTAQSVVDKTGAVFNGEAAHRNVRFKICSRKTKAWSVTYWARVP